MTLDDWLRAHPFLQPVATMLAPLGAAVARLAPLPLAEPEWSDYRGDFVAGVPLLRSANAAIDLEPAGAAVIAVIDELAGGAAGGALAADLRALAAAIDRGPGAAQRVADWLLGEATLAPPSPGLLRHVGWSTVARTLSPLLEAFGRWRNDDDWLRAYCPACGEPPAMAWLVGGEPARKRFLCCGCCGSRWRFQRSVCPFCEHDEQRVGVVTIDGEGGLRIDSCAACKGYVKTYDGSGDEGVLLADWTSLHLDVLAADRGLSRAAASLYDLSLSRAPAPPA